MNLDNLINGLCNSFDKATLISKIKFDSDFNPIDFEIININQLALDFLHVDKIISKLGSEIFSDNIIKYLGIFATVVITGEDRNIVIELSNLQKKVEFYIKRLDSKHFLLQLKEIKEPEEDKFNSLYNRVKLIESFADIGSWKHNVESKTYSFSEQIYEIFEVSKDVKLTNEFLLSFYNDSDKSILKTSISDCITKGAKFNHEIEIHANKNQKWINIKGKPVYENGIVVEVCGIIQNITDRKKIEFAKKNSERKYKNLFDLMPFGGEILDRSGFIISCSSNNSNLFGYSILELIGKHITELMTKDSLLVFKDKFTQILSGKTISTEVRFKHKSGRILHILRTGRPIFDTKGNLESILGINIDFTERKKIADQLIASEQKFRLMANLIPFGIFIVDTEGKEIYWNDQLCKISGIPREKCNNLSWFASIHPEDKNEVAELWEDAVKKCVGLKHKFRFLKRDTVVYVEVESQSIINNNGDKIGIIGKLREVME